MFSSKKGVGVWAKGMNLKIEIQLFHIDIEKQSGASHHILGGERYA